MTKIALLTVASLAMIACSTSRTTIEEEVAEVEGTQQKVARPKKPLTPAPEPTRTNSPDESGAPDARHGSAPGLYFGKSGVWPAGPNGVVTVKVCWENAGVPSHKAHVRDVILTTWGTILPVDFIGWADCDDGFWGWWPDAAPIRIQMADDRPYAYYPDEARQRRTHDVVLNFWFNKFKPIDNNGVPLCEGDNRYVACLDGYAIHEFGHALGFAHEQDQPDSPCATEQPHLRGTGASLTPYDPFSIMNYCDPTFFSSPQLSPGDITGAQRLYGVRASAPTYVPVGPTPFQG